MKREVKISTLSVKEKNVLALWVCGQTAKQSGIYLQRSSRTIEYYRERIKCKFGIYRISELYPIIMRNSEFEILIQEAKELMINAAKKNKDVTRQFEKFRNIA